MGQRGRPRHPDVLTPREQDVLSLVREGLTNEQIAARLGITFETAKHHVSEILSKLGVETREAAAAWREERRWWGALPHWALIGAAATVLVVVAALALGVWLANGADDPTDNVLQTTTPSEDVTDLPQPSATQTPVDITNVFADLPPPIPETAMSSTDDPGLVQGIYRYGSDGTLNRIAAADEPQAGDRLTHRMYVSANQEWLAFTSGPAGLLPVDSQAVYLKDLRSAGSAVAVAKFGRVWGIAVSPDARYLWVDGSIAPYNDYTESSASYLVDLQSRTVKEFPFASVYRVTWSPDGEHVAYQTSSSDGGTTVSTTYVANSDLSHPVEAENRSGALAWSADSRQLAVGGEDGLTMLQLDGTAETVNDTRIDSRRPINWSPDGTRLAYTAVVDGPPYRELAVRSGDGVEQRIPGATSGSWSPDGNSIAFVESGTVKVLDLRSAQVQTHFQTFQPLVEDHSWLPDDSLVFNYSPWAFESISMIRPDGTGLRHLAYGYGPILSPDGQRVAFVGQVQSAGLAGSSTIFVMKLDGTGLTRLAEYTWTDVVICNSSHVWSSDGTEITYASADGNQYSVAADGSSEPRSLGRCSTGSPPAAPGELIYSPDGTKVAYSAGTPFYDQHLFVGDDNSPEDAQEVIRGHNPQWTPDGQWILFTR